MNAKLAALKSHFLNWREWELNPIVIKELRQSVRSHALDTSLLGLLCLLFAGIVAAMGHMVVQGHEEELGRKVFGLAVGVLAIGGVLFMPLLTAWRVAQEREWADLLYFTPLSINQLVWGKAASGICLAGLYLSACLPFLMFSTLLRGVDFLTILAVVSLLFTAVGVTAIVAVAVGAAPVPLMFRPLLLWGFGAGLLLLVFGLVQGLRPVIQNGVVGDFPVFVYLLTASFIGLTGYGLSMTFINPRERVTKTRPEQLQPDGQAHG